MGLRDFLLTIIGGRVYVLRRKYDRVRERADRVRGRMDRLAVLKVLDQAEPQLEILEEQRLPPRDRKRIFLYVRQGIAKAEAMLYQIKERKKLQQS